MGWDEWMKNQRVGSKLGEYGHDEFACVWIIGPEEAEEETLLPPPLFVINLCAKRGHNTSTTEGRRMRQSSPSSSTLFLPFMSNGKLDSSPPSTSKLARVPLLSTEQRKNVLNFHWPFPKQPGFFYRWRSNATILAVFCLSKLVFCFNKIVVRPEQKQTFLKLLQDQNRPLITVCNHRCVMDDPFLWSMFTFREFLSNISRFRYILAAHDVCFTRNYHILFFSLGRCVPVVRGAGVFQQGVDYCLERLNTNGWVHIFPEGRVTREQLRIKWGIGRLIAESNKPPMLLPIWVRGMENVWTTRAPYRPRFWKTVEVSIGDPIDTTIWLDGLSFADESELGRRKRLADLVQAELYGMGKQFGK
ncbi:hypothetical protein GPALN_010998 [Globodera pallida]|nr:hypothetical protein GPALN_010998 [Globodera pallida]